MRHVPAHQGDALNDLADHWAKQGKHQQLFASSWNEGLGDSDARWPAAQPAAHVVPEHSVKGLEVALLKTLLATGVWSGLVTRWTHAKVARWGAAWTPASMRLAMGRVADLPARVQMALFTLWNNAWLTQWRVRL